MTTLATATLYSALLHSTRPLLDSNRPHFALLCHPLRYSTPHHSTSTLLISTSTLLSSTLLCSVLLVIHSILLCVVYLYFGFARPFRSDPSLAFCSVLFCCSILLCLCSISVSFCLRSILFCSAYLFVFPLCPFRSVLARCILLCSVLF